MLGGGKRVLLVGGEGIVLFGPTARGVEHEVALSWEVPNFDQQLVEALTEQNQDKPIVVVFDGADQTYRREENIPKLSMFDRPRFVRRKLDLAFPSYPVRAAIEVKPPKVKGRAAPAAPPSYLFAAISETERLDRVGAAMLEAGVPVAGFGLLPIESAGLVTTLADKLFEKEGGRSRWSVLIGQHETGGLRQVVVKDGNLALARLTPPTEAGTQGVGWVEEVVQEFRATLTYLSRFGYTPDDGLDVMIVCGDVEKQFFDAKTMSAKNFRCLKNLDALALLGVRGVGLEKNSFADAVHAAWIGKSKSLVASVKVPSLERFTAPRLFARVATGALALSMLALMFFNFTDYQAYAEIRDDIEQKETRKAMLEREYEKESETFKSFPVKAELVKGTMSIKKLLDQNTINPDKFFHRLRDALGVDIFLTSLQMVHEPAPKLKGETPSGGLFGAAPAVGENGKIKAVFRFTMASAIPLEQKVLRAEALLISLQQKFPGYEVKIASQFGNVSRTGSLQGQATGQDTAADPNANVEQFAEFSMEGPPL